MTVLPDAELPDIRPGDTVRKGTRGTVLWHVDAVERYASHAVAALSVAGKWSRGFTHALVLVDRPTDSARPAHVPWAAADFDRRAAALTEGDSHADTITDRMHRRIGRLESAGYVVRWSDALPFDDDRPLMYTEQQSLTTGDVRRSVTLSRGVPVATVYRALRRLDGYLDDPDDLFGLCAPSGDALPGGWRLHGAFVVRAVGLGGDHRV